MRGHHAAWTLALRLAVAALAIVIGARGMVAATRDLPRPVGFTSQDGLEVTADLYMPHPASAPLIVLFHQAGWSRGEYLEIAPRLNDLGYNCLAVDQRSGGEVNGVTNQTHRHARDAGKEVTYLDAYPDMVAALRHADASYADGSLIVWGSSYSASLAFRLAAENPGMVDGVVAFSPGEYFRRDTGDAHYVAGFASGVACPVFVTSARDEHDDWREILLRVTSPSASYLPETEGKHGSSALWSTRPDGAGYWQAVTEFLAGHFPAGHE